ncbi:hypothetical protein Lgra_3306 [Legionella gratiana]|uniref:Uncharacterized protein n=1 Tax=Legionella gratiana TaxID=45066 RepID=A0A378JKV6_9GAMM|nr:hypothetical protein Lgra_3306 [Legionella gratiana]STX45350.1 Uncharacterised protein [Legionella gratiana]
MPQKIIPLFDGDHKKGLALNLKHNFNLSIMVIHSEYIPALKKNTSCLAINSFW